MLVGAGYGCLERVRGGDWTSTVLVVGIAALTALIALYVLQLVTHVVAQAMKIVVPAAIVLALGHWLDWAWAEDVTDILIEVWWTSVEQVQAFWMRS